MQTLLFKYDVEKEDRFFFSKTHDVLDDFKCSLPDVKSEDDKLDVTRFRSDFSKISEVSFCVFNTGLHIKFIFCYHASWGTCYDKF